MCDLLSLPLPWPVREQTIVWLVTRQSRTVLLVVPTLYEGRCADHLPLSPCSRAWLGDCSRPRTRHSLLQRRCAGSKMATKRGSVLGYSRSGLSSVAYFRRLSTRLCDNNLMKRSDGCFVNIYNHGVTRHSQVYLIRYDVEFPKKIYAM